MKPEPIEALLALMARLRDPQHGCPWDQQQTFATIAPYTIEEAYEVADAIERQAYDELRSELGDLLFQVVFHARMAEEGGYFDFADVVAAIVDKMTRRHPHVFGDDTVADAAEQTERWAQLKAVERDRAGHASVLDDVPKGLPALARAQKLQRRAARLGLDWPEPAAVLNKLDEERAELAEAMADEDRAACQHEIGDLLFTVVNLARQLEVDADAALRSASQRFSDRVRTVEALATGEGVDARQLDAEALDVLWRRAKARTQAY